MSASKQSTMRRTLVMRLADAKRISEELKGVWEQMKMAYIDLIVGYFYLSLIASLTL